MGTGNEERKQSQGNRSLRLKKWQGNASRAVVSLTAKPIALISAFQVGWMLHAGPSTPSCLLGQVKQPGR